MYYDIKIIQNCDIKSYLNIKYQKCNVQTTRQGIRVIKDITNFFR